MNCIILAAGKDKNSIEKVPKCLRMVNGKTVLDNFIEKLEKKSISNLFLVGGFEILQIMEKYPKINFFYNEKWSETKNLYSLSKAFTELENNCLISYSDIVHKSSTLKLINKKKINIFYDSLWKTRYENRDLFNLERVENKKGEVLGEFSGLLYIPKKESSSIKLLISNLLKNDIRATLLDLINNIAHKNNVDYIDVSGNWAELDSVQDMMQFKFGTKAETLGTLALKLNQSKVLEQYTFTVGQYLENQKNITLDIQNKFSSKLLVVRSSALNEDTANSSMAGNYESILKVEKENPKKLLGAIELVIDSYRKNGQEQDQNNQILIQPYLEKVSMSGVVLSKNLQTSSPYYTVNYDKSENTESVTSGYGENLHTFICFNSHTCEIEDKRLSKLLDSVKEIENITQYDAIDVEFAFVNDKLYILQVRPIAAKKEGVMVSSKNVLNEIDNIKKLFDSESINLIGNKKAYGVMPDWNPAEIIGTNPKKLSFDLYRFLITDDIWAKSRAFLGYRSIKSPGLISLGGKPYVDIQMSFNTFVPAELPDDLSARLIDYFIHKLERYPQNHDKVEFLVAITAFDFTFDEKVKELLDNGFNKHECEKIKEAYKNLTQNIITGRQLSIEEELEKTLFLRQRREKVLSSNLDLISKIYHLLEDCKQYGTLPFANLARCGFIGSIFLKSLLEKGTITTFEYDEFFKSIHTVAKDFMDDFILLSKNQLSKEKFVDRYGHLRPGTYDITSKTYEKGFDEYIDFNSAKSTNIAENDFKFSEETEDKISLEISRSNLNFNVEALIKFIIKSTEARERSKFEFTKSLSVVLDLISNIGKEFNLSANDLSHLDLNSLLKYRNVSSRLNIVEEITSSIEKNKSNYMITCSLNLPELIFNKTDVEMFHYPEMKPNFITHHNVIAKTIFLKDSNNLNIENNIVCIENADPGFDWIFSHNIKGLITKYGGIASHMSIRCAEFDLPAAIGCGDKIFNAAVSSSKVNLDCANRKIRSL